MTCATKISIDEMYQYALFTMVDRCKALDKHNDELCEQIAEKDKLLADWEQLHKTDMETIDNKDAVEDKLRQEIQILKNEINNLEFQLREMNDEE